MLSALLRRRLTDRRQVAPMIQSEMSKNDIHRALPLPHQRIAFVELVSRIEFLRAALGGCGRAVRQRLRG
jgi:hypothetical protein